MDGWIKLHRKLIKHWVWSNEKYLKAWVYCLFRANHTESKILIGSTLLELEPGEFITSIGNFANDTGLSLQATRTFWQLLQNDKMIDKKSTSNSTRITICNYDSYQHIQQTDNKQTTNKQQTSNKPATTDKKEKNVNNDKEKINIPSWDEFKEYGLSKNNRLDISHLKSKYDAWIENEWKDGNNNEIKSWKSKLNNTIPFLKEVNNTGRVIKSENIPEDYGKPNPNAVPMPDSLKQHISNIGKEI